MSLILDSFLRTVLRKARKIRAVAVENVTENERIDYTAAAGFLAKSKKKKKLRQRSHNRRNGEKIHSISFTRRHDVKEKKFTFILKLSIRFIRNSNSSLYGKDLDTNQLMSHQSEIAQKITPE